MSDFDGFDFNIDVNDLLATILNKLDNVSSVNPRDIYGESYGKNKSKNLKAIEGFHL